MNIFQFLKNLIWPAEGKKNSDWPGCLPPLKDYRDILGSSLLQETTLPASYSIPYKLKVKDQNGRPACVGFSASLIKEEKELREKNNIEFDADHLYAECKKIDNYPGAGTYLNMPFKIMLKNGIKELNGTEADMAKYRIGGYVALDDLSHEGLKRAIYQWGAVVAGYAYSRQGWATEYIRPPKAEEATTGHAVALTGWNPDYLIGQNSFGKEWGREGMFFVSKDYRPFAAYAIIVDLPNNWQELLDANVNLPKPTYFFTNNLYYGLINDEVKMLQDALKWAGCLEKTQESTGYFGSKTLEAVKLYQQRKGIQPVSGYVGPLTRASLNNQLNS